LVKRLPKGTAERKFARWISLTLQSGKSFADATPNELRSAGKRLVLLRFGAPSQIACMDREGAYGNSQYPAKYLEAQGQAKAIEKVFAAIKSGRPTPELLAYQYLQTLPQMAQGDANKVWMIPSDFGDALKGFAKTLGAPGEDGVFRYEPNESAGNEPKPEDDSDEVAEWFETKTDPAVAEAVKQAVLGLAATITAVVYIWGRTMAKIGNGK